MKKIPNVILENIESVIKKYKLFSNEICIAYSGGKDSLFLCLALKELGYQVYPIIIDIGYNSNWDIALKNLQLLNIAEGELIDAEKVNQMMPETVSTLNENFENINKIKNGDFKKATICTPCYNSKMLIMQKWARINNIESIANGHHAIDSISSLLKSYYMYIDRWEHQHKEFVYQNFYNLILSQKDFYLCEADKFLKLSLYGEIKKQIYTQNAGTDEPIVQYLGDTDIKLCRPLFKVFEKEIIDYFEEQNIKTFNECECFATNFRSKNRLTPRELIQYELLRDAPHSLTACLLELVQTNLDENGFGKFNARNNREQILGNTYKNEEINTLKI